MTTTTHLGITLVEQSQSQKEITVNTALTRLDAFLNNGAKSRSINTPPGSPSSGDLYIVGPSPTGAWTGKSLNLVYFDQVWQFITPNEGITLWVDDENLIYTYNGSTWVAGINVGGTATIGQGLFYNGSQWTACSVGALDNRIINGDMRIDQRNEGASLAVSSDGVYTTDRWLARLSGTLRFTAQQVSDAPSGFVNSLKYTITTAEASLGAGDFCAIEQRIEGNNVADFAMGTSSAANIVIDFWVKTSLAGTYALSIGNSVSFNRSYVATFTVSSASTWQYVSFSIPGDTAGTWPVNTSAGMRIFITLAAGSTYQTATTGAWQGAGYFNTSSCSNIAATNGNNFQITGVRVQPGSIVLPYVPRAFGQELMLCQRYYEKTFSPGAKPAQNAGTTDAIAIVGNAVAVLVALWSSMLLNAQYQR